MNAAAQDPKTTDSVSIEDGKPSLMEQIHQVQQFLDTRAMFLQTTAIRTGICASSLPWLLPWVSGWAIAVRDSPIPSRSTRTLAAITPSALQAPSMVNNLTRNNSYELTIVTVGVAYGTEIQRVREVLVEGMQKMRTKDQYGRDIVDPNYGFNVVVGNMSDSAVDINVKQMVLVAERVAYFDRAKEAIYDALTAAGITIAFPQCDVHLIQEE